MSFVHRIMLVIAGIAMIAVGFVGFVDVFDATNLATIVERVSTGLFWALLVLSGTALVTANVEIEIVVPK